ASDPDLLQQLAETGKALSPEEFSDLRMRRVAAAEAKRAASEPAPAPEPEATPEGAADKIRTASYVLALLSEFHRRDASDESQENAAEGEAYILEHLRDILGDADEVLETIAADTRQTTRKAAGEERHA